LNKVITILLVLLALFQGAGRLLLVGNYLANKELITQKYCENKTRPELHCEGECHLKKQLQKEEKSESANLVLKQKVELGWLEQMSSSKILLFWTFLTPPTYAYYFDYEFVLEILEDQPPEIKMCS
jgi:hypothetical protein